MKNIKIISQKLKNINKHLYIVWWYTRDKFLNLEYLWDIDLATDASPEEMKEVLNVIKEVWKKYWTLIVREWNQRFEITTFRKDIWILDNRRPVNVEFTDNLELDSTRRDFTFNAIYFDVENDDFIDPQNWIRDLKNKIIRFIWNPEDRIKEDALRIIRFIRFKNKYKFENWENNYFEVLEKNISLLQNISIERIKEEFDKILLLENNIQALKDLKQIWFFRMLLPEIDILEKTPGWASHHLEWDVWVHTLMSIKVLNDIFKEWNKLYNINTNFSNQEKIDLFRTILLHDIWKFDTFSKNEEWIVHYYDHENISTQKTKDILKRFNFANNSIKKIVWLVENHLRIFKIFEMKTLKARKLMMNKFFEELIIVWISDHKWRIPTNENLIFELLEFYNNFLEILKTKTFLKWNYILEKYPELKWVEIKLKLNKLNDEILINDKN